MASTGAEKSTKKKTEKKFAAKEEAKLLASFMGIMNNLRKQKALCDVILVVSARKIPAHRVVLAAASQVFNLMFKLKKWTELCPMIEARKNHGLVCVNDRIYAVGGQNGMGGLDSVEYYDIKTGKWKMVSDMPWKGVTVKCAAVGSIIYVLAGFQGVGRLGHILEYHTEADKWVANNKVRAFPVTSCLICVVDTCGANEETHDE
ncbi:UNVERIFIED_CONTAM: hypothetical protein FKN15_029350 [Acipenser sinensis]